MRHVCAYDEGAASHIPHFRCHCLCVLPVHTFRVGVVIYRYVGAFAGEGEGSGASDALGRAVMSACLPSSLMKLAHLSFHQCGDAHAAASTQRGNAPPHVAAFHLEDERAQMRAPLAPTG